jgi:hypothetical protein
MTETFPIDNARLKEMVKKGECGVEFDEDDYIALEYSGLLSAFIENMIRLI